MHDASPGRLFRAFSDGTRLRLLHLLARRGELCVCDLQSALGLSQPKISRHLAYLRGAGLVTCRSRGAWKHYALARPGGAVHRGLVSLLRGPVSRGAGFRRDLAALSRSGSARGACR
jgi:ArsR family transcriptional regulator